MTVPIWFLAVVIAALAGFVLWMLVLGWMVNDLHQQLGMHRVRLSAIEKARRDRVDAEIRRTRPTLPVDRVEADAMARALDEGRV